MKDPQFKYNINHYINLLPGNISLAQIHSVLQSHYGISEEQFLADRQIEADSADEIPITRLMIYARVMAIPLQNLYTV